MTAPVLAHKEEMNEDSIITNLESLQFFSIKKCIEITETDFAENNYIQASSVHSDRMSL
jgi:hypothetical protein